YFWKEGPSPLGDCSFIGESFRLRAVQSGTVSCGPDPSFRDFAFEVQIAIVQGDGGGVIFRSDEHTTNAYFFSGEVDGSYQFGLYTNGIAETLAQGAIDGFHSGLHQANLLAVVAQNQTLALYVNHTQVASITDDTYPQGYLGVAASDVSAPTNVIF